MNNSKIIADELKKSEEILSGIGEGLVACDKNGLITFANKKAEELSGYSVEESIGKSYYDIWRLVDSKGVDISKKDRPFYLAFTKGEVTNISIESNLFILKKDGKHLSIASTISPIIVEGKVDGAIAVFKDITKDTEIDRMKSEFISLASHQLKNPITSIAWNLEALLDEDMGKLNEEQKKVLGEISKSNHNMAELISGFLDITKAESGGFAIEKGDVDLLQISDSVLDELTHQIADKKIKIEKKHGIDIPHLDIGIKTARVILQNLLTNAIKYTPENGTVEVSIQKNSEGISIYVKDNGYGIPEVAKSKIFTKLFRADNVREKEPTGTGLGLYLLKQLVEKIEGKVWFESKEGSGSTFYVDLKIK